MRLLTLALSAALAVPSVLAPTESRAELGARDVLARRGEREVKVLVNSYGEAYGWSNTLLDSQKQPRLFCVPGDLAFTTDQYFDLIDKAVKGQPPKFAEYPFGLVLLRALIGAYPCRSAGDPKPGSGPNPGSGPKTDSDAARR